LNITHWVKERSAVAMSSLHQSRLDFQLEKTSDSLTSKTGLVLFHEAALALGVVNDIRTHLPVPGSNRGIVPENYVMPLALMFCGGGRTMEDIRQIAADSVLRKLCGYDQLPVADAIGKWLKKPARLKGMKRVNERLAGRVITRSAQDDFTLDTDATLIESDKHTAKRSHEGCTGYWVLLSFLAELGLYVCGHYRPGNVPPSVGIKAQLEYTDRRLKSLGKHLKYFRSDSAAYCAAVINTCDERKITYTITADQDSAVMAAVARIPVAHRSGICDYGSLHGGNQSGVYLDCPALAESAVESV
jgi:hypothetical protein